ncbi:MAG: hypothetical protein V1709_07145 [Planctomycetota bacterium]
MLRNYMASAILTEAVRQKVVTETEADIVIDTAVYERSPWYLSRELGISPVEVVKTYERGIRKLKKWLCSGNFEAELLLLRYRWL